MQVSSRGRQARRTSRTARSRNARRHQLRSRTSSGRKRARGRVRATRSNRLQSESQAERKRLEAKHQAAVKNFAVATRHFYQHNYAKAKELFDKALNGASPEIVERARVHIHLCEQKLARPAPAPKTPTDFYNLGVAELNVRNLDLALRHLSKADKAAPNRDEIRYALAAAHALQGNTDVAFEHLKAAIALRPENRFQARHDEDFEPLRADPRFRGLIYPESDSTSQPFS